MGLSITRTDARLGIETTPGRFDMESRRASLELHQKQAKVNIESELPKVLIDQYEAFASAGLKNSGDQAREAADLGYQQVMEFIGKVAEDGDTFAQIESGGNPIASFAERDAFPEKEFGLGFIPTTGPKFDVTGELNIQAEPNAEGVNNGVEGNYIPAQLNVNYTPAVVRIYMMNNPSINISFTGGNIDTYI